MADWRFLLPTMPTGRALCVGGALSPVPGVLAQTCTEVTVLDHPAAGRVLQGRITATGTTNIRIAVGGPPGAAAWGSGERFALVAALRPADATHGRLWQGRGVDELARWVAPGGDLYLEVARPALVWPPPYLVHRLRRRGLGSIRCYWPKPTFARCELWLPLDDRRMQHWYLDHIFFAMSPGRRGLRAVLRALVAGGLFGWTLPGYAVVAHRPGPARRS